MSYTHIYIYIHIYVYTYVPMSVYKNVCVCGLSCHLLITYIFVYTYMYTYTSRNNCRYHFEAYLRHTVLQNPAAVLEMWNRTIGITEAPPVHPSPQISGWG